MTLSILRKNKKLTQTELSKKLYVSQRLISAWEKAERTPSIEMIPKLSKILNCSIEELVFAIINTKGE